MAGTITRVSSCARGLAKVGLKAAGTALSWSTSLVPVAQGLERTNFHGRTVNLRGGVGAAAGAVTAGIEAGRLLRGRTASPSRAGLAATVAAAAGGCAGLVDDLDAGAHDGDTPAKGLKGHLTALAHGRVTTGALKIAVIGSGALVSGVLLARHRSSSTGARPPAVGVLDAATSAVAVAAWANLLNLLDLRPGRALKTACIVSAPLLATPGRDGEPTRLLAAGTLGVGLMALPEDLLENTMLGDTGANAVGALLGTALACHPHAAVRAGAALSGVSLILASEKVSFSRVIADTPVLAALDGLGRRP
ncbi:hypothetical protein [Actinomyces oris]|uniref:Glycosyl transferase family 4 n=1 Tax=Actinomyces oris TaxID=544580 RepID=A0A1Q8HXH8_9ACTO|nr:hypothetical protein [Actinomyces oris]OLL13562.1 hypothetical protein BKH32_12340 [Actinomyces oris]